MTTREQRRAWVLGRITEGRLSIEEAGTRLGLSARQVWRLRAAERERGPAGLVHGNRGRCSAARTDAGLVERILALASGPYAGANDCHLAELLREREEIVIGRSTLRRILRRAGLPSPRRRRAPRHRSRRERFAAQGALLQLDGSRHDWLEGRGPWLTLLGAVDDATGAILGATFRLAEDAAGYLEILEQVVKGHGVPVAIYRDGHSAFAPTRPLRDDDPGEPSLSQVGRALVELGIASIAAGSPQAKGRIERAWGTLQGRLVMVLRLAGASDLASANRVLAEYLPGFNGQFAVPPADQVPAWRPVPEGIELERVFCFKYRRKVAKDHTVTLDGRALRIAKPRGGAGYAGRLVEVHVRLDGGIVGFDGERVIGMTPAPASPSQLRAGREQLIGPSLVPEAASLPWVPPADHPWRSVRRNSALGQRRLTESLSR